MVILRAAGRGVHGRASFIGPSASVARSSLADRRHQSRKRRAGRGAVRIFRHARFPWGFSNRAIHPKNSSAGRGLANR
jgi:hypothetical protein